MPRALCLGVGIAADVLVTGYLVVEFAHALAERRVPRPGRGPLVVLVLGCPTPESGRPSAAQRWRAQLAVDLLREGPGIAVFSGGRRRGPAAEADTMAGYARRLGLPESRILRETTALTTRENIARSLQVLEALPGADLGGRTRIAIASDPLHAARARRHLAAQRPDLAGRLVSAGAYRFGRHPVLKTVALGYEVLFGTPDRLGRLLPRFSRRRPRAAWRSPAPG